MHKLSRLAAAATIAAALIAGCKKADTVPPNTSVSTVPAGTSIIGADGKTINAPVGANVLVYPDGTVHAVPAGMAVTPGQIIGGPAPTGQPAPVTTGAAINTTGNAPGYTTPTGAAPAPTQPVYPGGPATTPPPAVYPSTAGPAPQGPVAPVDMVVPAGTRVAVRITETLTGHKANLGEHFSGVVASPVVVNGVTVFPRGTRVGGEVIQANGRGKFAGSGSLGIVITNVGGYNVSSSEYMRYIKGKGKRTAAFIGGGAGVGALIGGLAGGGKGALIGGLAGGGAGTAAGAMTNNKEVVIPSESVITFRLKSSIRVHP